VDFFYLKLYRVIILEKVKKQIDIMSTFQSVSDS